MGQGGELSGLRILVVEDEPLIAMDLKDVLRDSGCSVVGPALTLKQGMRLAENETVDGAILDVNLGGETVFPLADALAGRAIPFAYLTGYSTMLRPCNDGGPVLQKPYRNQDLLRIAGQWPRRCPPKAVPSDTGSR
jgi:DNA-binding response OmpR family regulator